MDETYCGKSCIECTKKEQLNCPGCMTGPGRRFDGDCELAKCVRGKGHDTCETCSFKVNCRTRESRYNMPDYRIKKLESEALRKASIARRAPILAKWLVILFWLFIPSEIGGIMANDMTATILPGLYAAGIIVNILCSFIYAVILLKLASEEDRYRTAGICFLVAAGVNAFVGLISGSEDAAWKLVFTLPAAVVAMVGKYNEYQGHAAILLGVDRVLADKWELLWKWYIGLYLGMFGSVILTAISPILGMIALIGAAIGNVVVGILELVYLYRTAKIFREFES